MEKFLENLKEAERTIKTADHMIYVTFPLIKDKKILLKILLEIKNAVANCINSILQREYIYKRISLYKDPKANFRIFEEKCSIRYNITKEEIKSINKLFELTRKHKESPFEFVRNDNIVIMSEGFKTDTINLEKTKEFLVLAKKILLKAEKTIIRNN